MSGEVRENIKKYWIKKEDNRGGKRIERNEKKRIKRKERNGRWINIGKT